MGDGLPTPIEATLDNCLQTAYSIDTFELGTNSTISRHCAYECSDPLLSVRWVDILLITRRVEANGIASAGSLG